MIEKAPIRESYIRTAIFVLILGLIALGTWYQFFGKIPPKEGPLELIKKMEREGIPEFELKDIESRVFHLDQVKGKVLIVNFWATWCDPCVREFPSMLRLVDHFKGEVQLVAISSDTDLNDIQNFLSAFDGHRENVHILWDPAFTVAKMFGTLKLPESYIVNRDLKLHRKIVGLESWDHEAVLDFMKGVVGTP